MLSTAGVLDEGQVPAFESAGLLTSAEADALVADAERALATLAG